MAEKVKDLLDSIVETKIEILRMLYNLPPKVYSDEERLKDIDTLF